MDDAPIRRNLLVTQTYHRLTLAMAELFGHDLAWPVFATWASRHAGLFIRQGLPDGPL